MASLNGKDVTSAKAKVGGTEADCYILDKATGDQLCLRADGIAVKFTLAGSELVVSTVETEVDDAAFTPPAEPSDRAVVPTTARTPMTTG